MGIELRAEARITVSRRAALSAGEDWFPCMIVDASESGFAMVCTRPLVVEQILDFRCELYPQSFFECKIEIRHLHSDGAGVMITNIDDAALELWRSYVKDQSFVSRAKGKATK